MAYVRPDVVAAVDAADAARAASTARLAVDVRGHAEPADYAQLPFYRRAK